MKTFTKSLSGLLSASALAIGLSVIAQPAAAAITGSAHDLSSGLTTLEICVFCHTPHGANVDVPAPLWNKGTTTSTYIPYTSSTMDGAANVGSVSLACLSCHDGSQAVDNMINQPGSGGYNVGGVSAFGGSTIGTAVSNLGSDLSNDHPIGMVYCGALSADDAATNTVGVGGCLDDSFTATVATDAASGRFWVDTDASGTYQKTDMPLYVDGQVECATCHDPHTPDNGTFLRIANDGSAVCLACHDK